MNLFEYKDYNLTYAPQTLELLPFKALWKRDKSYGKKRAVAELSFIYFMCDPKSDFSDITDDDQRRLEIVKNIELPENWKPDAKVKVAMDFYKERSETVTSKLLKNIIMGVEKIGNMFKDIDPYQTDANGKPVHNVSQLITAAAKIPELVNSLKEAQDAINRELEDKSRLKGDRQKAAFEDGI